MSADSKQHLLYRTYAVFFLLALGGLAIFVRAVQIQLFEGAYWRKKAEEMYVKKIPIEATRGNIYAHDGSLLATSLPYYEVRWDPMVVEQDTFDRYLDELSTLLASYISPDLTAGAMRQRLLEARRDGNRGFLVGRNLSYPDLQRLKTFPIFRLERNKGGLTSVVQNKRQHPFKILGRRTIGFYGSIEKPGADGLASLDTIQYGLESAYNQFLAGEQGEQTVHNIGRDVWVPIADLSKIEPKAGMDLVTTLDVNIQDVAETALMRAMETYRAKGGCAVVMEVSTGAIRAMANIGRTENNEYWETYNFAASMSTEPGSTFKLATMLALLEDNLISLQDTVNLEGGRARFYDQVMEDALEHGEYQVSVQRAFELSSNVGMAKLVEKHYTQNRDINGFLDRIRDFRLDKPTGIDLENEPNPYIKDPKNAGDNWSGITLPWMSTGYELRMTPLQQLVFYNAVANGGKMMKPYLVEEIRDNARTHKRFGPQVLKRRIAGAKSIQTVTDMLEGVVKNGTASNIYTDRYRIAGKTGTSIVNYSQYIAGKAPKKYQASFAGFFPAEQPLYSCIVVIYEPETGLYGGTVAAPVFRAIADRCYASSFFAHEPLPEKPAAPLANQQLPDFQVGFQEDFKTITKALRLKTVPVGERNAPLALLRAENDTLKTYARTWKKDLVPNVVGMGLRDAVFLLENLGIRVQSVGVGKVKSQSVKPGQSVRSVRSITLVLD
jgi:cell division protein FtsI (penicillin-binding protein 3)